VLITPFGEWLRSLKTQRSRTISTLMGVGWGTFSVVAMLAFGAGLEDMMRERARGMGNSVVVTWPSQTTMSFEGIPEGRQLLVSDEDLQAILDEVPGIGNVSGEYVRSERVSIGSNQFLTTLNGVFPSHGEMRAMRAQTGGRFLNEEDQRLGRRVIFLGDRIKRQLFGDGDAIGAQLVLAGAPFTVIGVMQPKVQDSDYDGLDEMRICIPSSTYRRLFGDRWMDNFIFHAQDASNTSQVIDGVYKVLGRRLHFDPNDRYALNVWDTTETQRVRDMIFLAMRLMVGLAGSLTLMVGGLGVGNLMYVLIKRRTSEIGIQMAIGALPRWILLEIMLQTLILVSAGGLLGFLGAWLLTRLVAISPFTDAVGYPHLSVSAALATISLLVLVGLTAGFFPARRAAKLDPVRALVD
jgi:putative ABC transport system permease protein